MIDIWTLEGWKLIPTNGQLNKRGLAVMGAGLAKQAATRYPLLPELLGMHLKEFGNVPAWFPEYKVITFPTKYHWTDLADFGLIKLSAKAVAYRLASSHEPQTLLVPKVGCGLGGLRWNQVKPVLDSVWSDVDSKHQIAYV